MKRTEGIWYAKREKQKYRVRVDGVMVADCLDYKHSEANANFICEAVNSHASLKAKAEMFAELVEGLEDAQQTLMLCTLVDRSGQAQQSVDRIEALLKRAKEVE